MLVQCCIGLITIEDSVEGLFKELHFISYNLSFYKHCQKMTREEQASVTNLLLGWKKRRHWIDVNNGAVSHIC